MLRPSSSRLWLTASLALGCSGPTAEVVAREQTAPAPVVVSEHARGRVRVVSGQLISDIGTPLRGVLLPVDAGWSLDDFSLMTSIAQTSGLNAVHVYLENWGQETGSMRAEADALVSLTAQAGLYLVLGIGGGADAPDHPGNGWFDLGKVRSFWQLYAARYAKSTHVLFEIQNNPEFPCQTPLKAETIAMEREAYQLIRGLAPDSHIVMFSTGTLPQPAVVEQALDDVSDVVDFGNVSFAVHHDQPCLDAAELASVAAAAGRKQVPLLIGQLPNDGWQPLARAAEGLGIGWLHHRWLAPDATLSTLQSESVAAGLSWCPDQGDFPEAASSCR